VSRRGVISRMTLMVGLIAPISWVAFHRNFLATITLEQALQRFMRCPPSCSCPDQC
jgi:hypothetical protein